MAAKIRSLYVCQNCGASFPQWLGQCSTCKEWNTLVEEVQDRVQERRNLPDSVRDRKPKPVAIEDISADSGPRLPLGDRELDRVLGGGVVPGSLILMGGDPGIGKSTLMLQTALRVKGVRTLYVSGEESEQQVKMRAERLMPEGTATETSDCFVQPACFNGSQ